MYMWNVWSSMIHVYVLVHYKTRCMQEFICTLYMTTWTCIYTHIIYLYIYYKQNWCFNLILTPLIQRKKNIPHMLQVFVTCMRYVPWKHKLIIPDFWGQRDSKAKIIRTPAIQRLCNVLIGTTYFFFLPQYRYIYIEQVILESLHG